MDIPVDVPILGQQEPEQRPRKYAPQHDWLAVKKTPRDIKSKGGIYLIPPAVLGDNGKPTQEKGDNEWRVLAVGPKVTICKPGDSVDIMGLATGRMVDGESFHLVQENQVVGILTDAEESN